MHQSLYKFSKCLGVGCLLLSVSIAAIQLSTKARISQDTEVAKASIAGTAEVTKAKLEASTHEAEQRAQGVKRELDAYQSVDKPNLNQIQFSYLTADKITADLPYWKTQPKNSTVLVFDKFWNCAGIWDKGAFTADKTICKTKQAIQSHGTSQQK